jgi:2-polyprenyl-3-methyl-5-hydroxy-6-metoxy-1,4-benzoquinol methylase
MSIEPGHYARKQLLSESMLVRWSHGSRFRLARELVAPHAGRRLLDYGCGDGTFLAFVQSLFPTALGVDIDPRQIADCAMRFVTAPGIRFLTTDRLADSAHDHHYEVVACMEVLEHCPDDIQAAVLDELYRVMAPGGTLVISVPIEIGPPLVAKQCARALIAMRGASEYATRERYAPRELVRMMFAGADTQFPREEYRGTGPGGLPTRYTGHKGFNWRKLRRAVGARFTIERQLFSPVPVAGPWLNSQVWFVCRKH